MARKHDVRLAVLADLARRPQVPLTLDALAAGTLMGEAGVSRPELMEELPGLIEHGYVVNHLAGRGWLLKIAARGLDQVRLDAPRDEYVYGDAAYIGR